MKNLVIIIMTATVCTLLAENIEVNGSFSAMEGKNIPKGWVINDSFKPLPKTRVETVSKGEINLFEITTDAKKNGDIFYSRRIPAAPVDRLLIKADVKGTGKIQLGYYGYPGRKEGSVANEFCKPSAVSPDKFCEMSADLIITSRTSKPISEIYIVIRILPNSDVTLKNLRVELQKDKDEE